jgi:hypothetical protein
VGRDRFKRSLACAAAASLLVAGVAEAHDGFKRKRRPGDGNRSRAVVYVHGFDLTAPGESNCRGVWGDRDQGFIGRIVDWGHRGPQQRVKYYREDTECTLDLHHHGKHRRHHRSGHRRGGHTVRTSIRHLGYHFAWQIWAHYTKRGQPVNVIAHSMGGLIVRYALAQVQRDHRRFPPRLSIANVVTLGTPHKGAPLAALCDVTEHRQCNQMDPTSGFIRWLRRHAKNPQGRGGTDWTVVGSRFVDFPTRDSDGVVPASSAVGMRARHKVFYLESNEIGHSGYYRDLSKRRDANVRWKDRGGHWHRWYSAPHVARWTEHALRGGRW